jgi:uncharacterized protein YdaU (DUF1376 family)
MGGHFYAWFPGDYMRDTAHLSMTEDAAYRRLLDSCYMTEKVSANAEVLLRVCRAVTPEEQEAVRKVAAEFFEVRDGYLYHAKVEHELARSRSISGNRSIAGKKGAAVTNSRHSANAAALAAANAETLPSKTGGKTSANERQPIPSVYVEGKPSTAASLPDGKQADPIFGFGLDLLKAKGSSEKSARGFLGLMRKNYGDVAVIEALSKAERDDITEPTAWIKKFLESSTKPKTMTGKFDPVAYVNRNRTSTNGKENAHADDGATVIDGTAERVA